MLREMSVHADWCEMTMSMMREKQFEACERRLFAHPGVSLFSDEATDADAQALFAASYDGMEGRSERLLVTIPMLRELVAMRLPLEALYVSIEEYKLLERLLMNDGVLPLSDWDDIGAAEALLSRMWCGFRAEGDQWTLLLPQALHEPLLSAMNAPEAYEARERVFRYDATIHGLLYIAGLLHSAQPMSLFLEEVIKRDDLMGCVLARRYLMSSFEYMTDGSNNLILLHPGLADPYRLLKEQNACGDSQMELTEEMLAGGISGILPDEAPLHEALCGALMGALRPEYDANECAEDLRMLAKQGVGLAEMQSVLAAMLATLPTKNMLDATEALYLRTPHWVGLKAAREQ